MFDSTKAHESSRVEVSREVEDIQSLSPEVPRRYFEHPRASPVHEEVSIVNSCIKRSKKEWAYAQAETYF